MEGFPYSVTLPVYTHQMQNNPFHRPHTVLKCLSYLGKYLPAHNINRHYTLCRSAGRIPCDDDGGGGGGDGGNNNSVGVM